MAAIKKIKLQWTKSLMIFSQAVLLLFAALWLAGQYSDQRQELKENLVKLFTDVQQKVADSLLLTHIIDPVQAGRPGIAGRALKGGRGIALSPQGLHRVLAGASAISFLEEQKLFGLDTIVFNELFVSQMKQNGWNFNAEWINSSDSNNKGNKAIFIQSSFFTDRNGVVVKNYSWYLYMKLLPQFIFVIILLSLTSAAFWITYKNLRSQIRLTNLKDDFISNMSHELKTPIATVKIALEALNNFNVIEDPKLSREYLCMATSEMDRLELLATRVLNTSLLESGRIYLQRETYDLKKLVEEVLKTMQLRVQQQAAKILFESSGDQFQIPVDRLHMQGVLVNLVDNSLKYGVAPVRILIRLTQDNGAVQLSLTDNGPGIPEEYREKVFEKFFRVPTGNRHNTKGYGLGLSYAAQVMRQHNGSINVDNIAGGGCVFTLSF
jgi:signal transduction histidine kinase